MATIELKKARIPSDVSGRLYLKDNGVAVAWTSLEDVHVHAFSVAQNAIAGPCTAAPDESDPTRLNVTYPASTAQYPGVAKLVVVAKYHGRVKSYDVPVVYFVKSTEEVTGYQVIEDPEVDVAIQVEDSTEVSVVLEVADVSTSLLDQAIQDAEDAADAANAAAQDADAAAAAALAAKEDADTAAAGANTAKQNANSAAGRANSSATNANNAAAKANAAAEHGPKIETGTWWVWDATNEEYVDTGIAATGPQGLQGAPGADGADGEDGEDGITPHIDATTGHWFIGDADTGVSAQGPQGPEGPPEIFWATYGTTTRAEIIAAVTAGKEVMCYLANEGLIYRLNNYESGDDLTLTSISTAGYLSNLVLNSIGEWSHTGYHVEKTSNRRTTWQATPDNSHYPSEKLVYDSLHPAAQSTQPVTGMLPNILYNFGELAGDTTFLLNTTDTVPGVNHYFWIFETGSTAPTITWPAGLTWQGGSAPTINASKHYEISVLNGIAVAMEV